MCLIVQDNKVIKTAEKDIECYKVIEEYQIMDPIAVNQYYSFLRKHGYAEKDAKYLTPFMCYPVVFGHEYYEPNFKEQVIAAFDFQSAFGTDINNFFFGGMYHSYMEKDDSVYAMSRLKAESSYPRVLKIAKCIIPEGSKYLVGIDDSYHLKCYGSEKLIYKEIVENQ